MWIFAKAIMAGEPIKLFNHGNMRRDFTYVDDVVESIVRLVDRPPRAIRNGRRRARSRLRAARRGASTTSATTSRSSCWKSCGLLEEAIGKKAKRELLPMQPGDVPATYADIDDLMRDVGFRRQRRLPKGSFGSSNGIATIIARDVNGIAGSGSVFDGR